MRVLLTGGAGFIGHHLVEHLADREHQLVILDGLNYAGRLDRLGKYRNHPRISFHFHDLRAALPPGLLEVIGRPDWVVHSAAETHVENSLSDPKVFIESNVMGSFNILQAARTWGVEKFLYVSTDEVFGPAPPGTDYTEDSRFAPTNPYSATKAGGECLAMAWAKSFGLPLLITRTMNNFGERQHPEKYIPMCLKKILAGEGVTVHWDGEVVGSRKWLHARNHADAICFLLERGEVGMFHIAGEEFSNLEIAQKIAGVLKKPLKHAMLNFHASRPGHDLRYSLSDAKLRGLGWVPPVDFGESLQRTILWTQTHPEWLL